MDIKNVHLVLLVLLIHTSIVGLSQSKEVNIWYFGDYCGLDFVTSPPTVLTNSQMESYEGCATISNSAGELLFYTNGLFVWNANHDTMPNGFGLAGHENSTQTAVIVPYPGNSNLYYLFTTPFETSSPGLCYNLIDMSLDNGNGDIVIGEKNKVLYYRTTERITGVRHANNNDIWVITHDWDSNVFRSFLIDDNGLNTTPVTQAVGRMHTGDTDNSLGCMKASPDGHKLAVAFGKDHIVEVLNFDNSSANISNPIEIAAYNRTYGIEFSLDNSKLYFSQHGGKIYQINLSDLIPGHTYTGQQSIGTSNQATEAGSLQLGPDGIIYCIAHLQSSLDAILNPNEEADDCNFTHYFANTSGVCYYGLPNFVQSYFGPNEINFENTCFGNTTLFSIQDQTYIDSVFWNFNDVPNQPNDTSTSIVPEYLFSHEGIFNVSVILYNSGNTDTLYSSVDIHSIPDIFLGNDTLLCDLDFNLTLNPNYIADNYIWSTGAFGSPEIVVSDTGYYWVKAFKDGCSVNDTIYVGLSPEPELDESALQIEKSNCGTATGSISGIVISGAEPIIYSWIDINGDTLSHELDIYNLLAGSYSLLVNDASDCNYLIATYVIEDDGSMVVDSVQTTNDYCSQNIGSINIFIPPSSIGQISYSIDGGLNYLNNSGIFDDLPAGVYNIVAKDENGCVGTFANNPVTIENQSSLQVTQANAEAETGFQSNGVINIEAFSSYGSVNYSINNGTTFQIDNGLFTNLSSGNYICYIADDVDCDTTFEIFVPREISNTLEAIAGNGSTCIGNAGVSALVLNNFDSVYRFEVMLQYDPNILECDGYINLNPELEEGFHADVNPSQGEVSIVWQGNDIVNLPALCTMVELVFRGIEQGNSDVNWDVDHGVSQFFNIDMQEIDVQYQLGNVRVYTSPEITLDTEIVACYGENLIVNPGIDGGNGQKSYLWIGPDGFSTEELILEFTNLQLENSGTYKLQVEDTLQCSDTKEITLVVNSLPYIDFTEEDTIIAIPGFELHAGSGYKDYMWITGAEDEYIVIDTSGMYKVDVTSNNGCAKSDSVYVIIGNRKIYLPNAFTPNGDGLNDSFRPLHIYDYITSYHLAIFNRWGQLIFESFDKSEGWNGDYVGEICQTGAYIYKIDYRESGNNKETNTVQGTVELIR